MKQRLILMILTFVNIPSVWSDISTQDSETIIVTGVHEPSLISEEPLSITVFDRDTLERFNKSALTDVLRNIPGLQVTQQGSLGGVSEVMIRGSESNFVAVYVDGVQVNEPTNSRGGSFNFNSIPLEIIERIEVVRGPLSAVYGSDALAGAIQIITRSHLGSKTAQLQLEVSEPSFSRVFAGIQGDTSNGHYALQIGTQDSGEFLSSGEYKNRVLNGRWSQTLSDNEQWGLSVRYLDEERFSYPEQSGGPLFSTTDGLETGDGEEWGMNVHYRGVVWGLRSQMAINAFQRETQTQSPGISPFNAVPPTLDSIMFERYQARWINSFQLDDTFWSGFWGIDYRYESGNSRGQIGSGAFAFPSDFELTRKQWAGLGHIQYQFDQTWHLQMSLRYDRFENSEFDDSASENTAHIALHGSFDSYSVSVNWATGFKLPSFFALAHPLIGNPDLKPEEAESWDFSLKKQLSEQANIHLNIFSNRYRNLIDFDADLFLSVNRDKVETQGAEIAYDMAYRNFSLSTWMTYLEFDIVDSNDVLNHRPRWQWGTSIHWFITDDWQTTFNYSWYDERFATSLHSGFSERFTLQNYAILDMTMSYQYSDTTKLSLSFDNILDADYQEAVGFPGQSSRARASISIDF